MAATRVLLLIVGIVLIAACTHSADSQGSVAGCGSDCGQAGMAGATPPQESVPAPPAAAPGCGTYCQQAGNGARGGSGASAGPPGYPCASTGCLQCPPQNCVTVQSNEATAGNGVITVPVSCNLSAECVGAFLLCLPNGALCEAGHTEGGGGGRLAASDFTIPAGSTANVPVVLTDLGKQVASGPGGFEASVFIDLQDYGDVMTNNNTATGDFSLTTNDPPEYPAGATASCGGVVFAGPNTSCPFAERVVNAYTNANGAGNGPITVTATSPVTGQAYTMQCSGQSPISCTGGNNELVVFYT